jgi:tRNA (guanine-N7-)-methyltransferase
MMSDEEIRTNHSAFLAAAHRAEFKPRDYFAEAKIDGIFPRLAPLDLDLGCGDGSFLVAMARRHPERNFLGTERQPGRVEKVARKIAREELTNARVLRLESHYAARHLLPEACIAICYILFPDPWPKRHHHPRRLFQEEFMSALHRVLAPGGELRVKTDDLPYFQWMEKLWERVPGYQQIEWETGPDWPHTDFEQQFLAKGLPIYRARLRKV